MNQNAENSNPDCQSPFKDIFEAAEKGTVEDVQYFVETKRSHVNLKDEDGWTPLHVAAKYNPRMEVIKYFISQDVYVDERIWHSIRTLWGNCCTVDGEYSPLHLAARSNPNIEVVRYLISMGADVNLDDGAGVTPLDLAKNEEVKSVLREADGQTREQREK